MQTQAMAEATSMLVPVLLAAVVSVVAAAVVLSATRPGLRPLQQATAAAHLALSPPAPP